MTAYPKPSDIGGTLIRRVIALLKTEVQLPLQKPILIATSGGVDSMVLAHLVCKYGRKIIDPKLVTLLHFDHQWRKESGTIERKAVAALAKKLGAKFLSVKLDSQRQKTVSKNLEDDARKKRNAYFMVAVGLNREYEYVLTAHHADDVVETLVWRFFRGELMLQSRGILLNDNNVLRPFLKVFKEEIYAYARAEKIKYYEDPSNRKSTQMRAFLRTQILPKLEKYFPGYRQSILNYTDSKKSRKT